VGKPIRKSTEKTNSSFRRGGAAARARRPPRRSRHARRRRRPERREKPELLSLGKKKRESGRREMTQTGSHTPFIFPQTGSGLPWIRPRIQTEPVPQPEAQFPFPCFLHPCSLPAPPQFLYFCIFFSFYIHRYSPHFDSIFLFSSW